MMVITALARADSNTTAQKLFQLSALNTQADSTSACKAATAAAVLKAMSLTTGHAPLVLLLGVWSLPLIQVALLTAGGLVLHQLAQEDLEPRLANWIAISYFCAGIVIGPTLENFHDLCAIPLLSFSLLLGIRRKNPWLYGIPALLLPLVREDVGLLSFSFGLWMVLRQRKAWRWAGLGLCLYSALMVFTITNHVMPLFGSEVSVPTLDGASVLLKIKSGTQSGSKHRVKGRGIETTAKTGDLIVTIDVHIPTKVSKEERDIIEQLAELHNTSDKVK